MSRRRREGILSANRRPPGPTNLLLTKGEIASRELVVAIRLWFSGADPVAIHVLASACAEIVAALNAAAGHRAWRTVIHEVIRPEVRDEFDAILVEPYNFMKHGARDVDATLEHFNPELNSLLLLQACIDLTQVVPPPFEVMAFLYWMYRNRPGLFLRPLEGFRAFESELGRTDPRLLKEVMGDFFP